MYALMWPREPESNARTGGATQLYGLHATYIIHCFGCVYFSASTFLSLTLCLQIDDLAKIAVNEVKLQFLM